MEEIELIVCKILLKQLFDKGIIDEQELVKSMEELDDRKNGHSVLFSKIYHCISAIGFKNLGSHKGKCALKLKEKGVFDVTIAYMKTTVRSENSIKIQRHLIEQYCKLNGLVCEKFFCDLEIKGRTLKNVEKVKEELEFIRSYKNEHYFEEWDNMFRFIRQNSVEIILVESIGRIFTTKYQYEVFSSYCKEHDIRIIEVCNQELPFATNEKKHVVVYHFTNKSLARPVIAEKEIDNIYEMAATHSDWEVSGFYFDTTLKKSEQKNYQRFRDNASRYDVLLTNDFYHIQTKTGPFMSEIEYLNKQRVEIDSLVDGKIQIKVIEELFQKPLRVAVYHSKFHEDEERSVELQMDIFKMFIKYKTQWTLEKIYCDECRSQIDGEQKELIRLLENHDQYDLVLVKCFHKFHWRTAMFSKRRKILGLPIYSLQEGYLNERSI